MIFFNNLGYTDSSPKKNLLNFIIVYDLCEIDNKTGQRKTEININKLKQIKNNKQVHKNSELVLLNLKLTYFPSLQPR